MNESLEHTINTFKLLHEIAPTHSMDIYTNLSNKYVLKHEKELFDIFKTDTTKLKSFYINQENVIYRTVRRYQNEIYKSYMGR